MRKWRGWKDVKSDWWKIENGSDPAQTSWKEPEDLAAVWWCVMEAEPPKPFALQSQPPDVRRKRGRSTKYEKRFHMPQKLSSIIMSVWILFTLLNPQRMSCVSLWWYKCATMCYRSFLTQPVLCATGVQELRPRLVLRPGDEVRLPAAVRRVWSRGQRLPRRPPSPAGRHLPGKKKKTDDANTSILMWRTSLAALTRRYVFRWEVTFCWTTRGRSFFATRAKPLLTGPLWMTSCRPQSARSCEEASEHAVDTTEEEQRFNSRLWRHASLSWHHEEVWPMQNCGAKTADLLCRVVCCYGSIFLNERLTGSQCHYKYKCNVSLKKG